MGRIFLIVIIAKYSAGKLAFGQKFAQFSDAKQIASARERPRIAYFLFRLRSEDLPPMEK